MSAAVGLAAPPSAEQKRADEPLVAELWGLTALGPQLPLVFPISEGLPSSPKRRYRSQYRPLDPAVVSDPERLAPLSDFEIAVGLIDFSPLERVLAPMYVASAKGQIPFHPVSLFLTVCLRRELNLGWRALARLVAGPHGAGWRTLFGFTAGLTPSASGLRYFFQAVGAAVFDDLCPRFVTLLRQHGLFPERSTYPGDPPERGITVSQDGMLHPARHRPSCDLATDACYQPCPPPAKLVPAAGSAPPAPGSPPPDGPPAAAAPRRPCRAREKGRTGCACATAACREQCGRASRLDPEARFIHYAGHNGKRAAPAAAGATAPAAPRPPSGTSRGTNVFGYRSIAERALDDRFAVAWTLRSTLYPANTDERTVFPTQVQTLVATCPDLHIGEWLDDAGVGFDDCLDAIWRLGALRMVDIRAHKTDEDSAACVRRGYDAQGRPLCPHGSTLRSHGYDAARRRAKYVCAQACRREPLRDGAPVQPVTGCPYLDPAHPTGFVVNVGRTLPDGSLRLAREIPVGSPAWHARDGRRNLSESRNGQLERMGLKRLPSYGLARGTQEVQLADFLVNLRTLGRLVRAGSTPPPAARPT
jgi:hypothetical protein